MATANSLLTIAESYIGTKESPANSNNVLFNTWYYGRTVSGSAYPWCAAFVSYCLAKAGITQIGKYASCGAMINANKSRYHSGSSGIRRGDIVFYSFSSAHDHTGIVKSVSSSEIVAIEGNTSLTSNDNGGKVMQRTRSKSKIYGYIRPPFDAEPTPSPQTGDPIVMAGQKASINFTGVSIGCDGLRGPETRRQAVRVLQKAINRDYGKKLELDGIIGAKTRLALGTHYVKRGEKQYMVTAAEIMLMMMGKDPKGIEYPGIFGAGLEKAAGKSKITASDFISYTK